MGANRAQWLRAEKGNRCHMHVADGLWNYMLAFCELLFSCM